MRRFHDVQLQNHIANALREVDLRTRLAAETALRGAQGRYAWHGLRDFLRVVSVKFSKISTAG